LSVAVLAGNGISAMDHPPHSPDLAPADIWLFPKLKSVLKGKRFSDLVNITSYVKKVLTDIPVQDFKNYFEQRPKHWEHCKNLEGGYFEKFLVANICSP
jgi:histone-lysine N-methyltransferase SETMAR